MAEDQGNIRQESNSAQAGLNQDNTLSQVGKGSLTYALNAAIENFDSNSVNYQNELGNEFCVSFPKDFVLIGTHFINEQSKHLFLLTNPITKYSEFGYMINNDCVYRKLVGSLELGWNIHNPIHKIEHRITNCSTEIYWPDNIARRYMDIDNPPYKLQPGSALCNPVYTNELDCNQLRIQPLFNIPKLEVVKVQSGGGNITSGTIQFAIQYSDAAGNPFTSYYSVTNPTPIADPDRTTVEFNYPVAKSIVLDISNLDVTGKYDYYNLAVLKTVNSVTSVELVGTYFIDGAHKTEIYTGQNVDNIRLSIKDIFEKFPYYDIATDITAAQDVLIWSGLTSVDRVNYQSIASKITLLWQTYEMSPDEDYSDEINATNLKSFLRDEVYPMEIVYLLDNGKQTDGFHIPGRVISPTDELYPDVPTTNPDFIGNPSYTSGGVGYSPYWKIYNTARVLGNVTNITQDHYIGTAKPYQYGTMAYWESSEVYPCNVDMWGDLANKPIRHHKFPDVLVSPISKPVIGYNGTLSVQKSYVYPIGLKVNNNQIKTLIRESSLTELQKAAIVGYKIIRGDRASNKSIIAKGMLRNLNTYSKDNQTFLFPNYPYNDLKQDPFLNTTNNSWTFVAKPFNVDVLKFNKPDDSTTKTYLEVSYIDPNTNKDNTIKYTTLGVHVLCSVSTPVGIGDGVKNSVYPNGNGPVPCCGSVVNISSANYDIYKVKRCHNKAAQFEYDDIVMGKQQLWVGASVNLAGRQDSYIIHIKVGSPITQIDGRGSICPELIEAVRGTDCGSNTPLPGIKRASLQPHRQVFNSPETSFSQPFLGNILKLENVMYGAGKAHFVSVKNNAKYRLLTKEAQEDALRSSNDLGNLSDPFNAPAMFSAYQAYLEIYINGITRRNYGMSFNSTASYDYSADVRNSGNKQRTLDISRYLIPGVQNVGDTFNVNNYQRETSVYLKTDKNKTALYYPSEIDTIPIDVTDTSRITITSGGACSSPAEEVPISVVSYYASLKNDFINQWGQIYTYNIIDTGFQKILEDTSPIDTVFGGDTFISKFAYKTKLPFFTDNRVGAPDDSDIFYDELGNIAYPKYWHSARSILSDFNVQGSRQVPLSNFVSYKAHNFDCKNSQAIKDGEKPDTNPSRTYYDGYFYMFAYGVPSFYCESSYNTDLRQAFNNREGDFWPHVSSGIPDDWMQESFVSIRNDNTYTYNTTFSKQNKENSFTHLPPDWNNNLCATHYPFRAVYSDAQNIDSDNKVNSWLAYRAVSYFDFPQNYGKLISLDGIQNKAILASFENKTLMYNNLLTLDTSNPQSAYVGNPNMFKGAPPVDFAETDLGYVGSQNKLLLKIPQGQIKVDAKRGQVFLIEGTSARDLTAFGSGMNRFFTENLSFNILSKLPNVDTDNHFNGIGIHGVYDSKFERVILTKLDYLPIKEGIKYDSITKEFYIEETV